MRILIVGTMAWDRPVFLKGPLVAGTRVRGTTLGERFDGRLGGGGANAACALLGAGHEVRLVSLVSTDEQRRRVMSTAKHYGISMEFVTAHDFPSATTLVFIDKHGERTIVGLDAADWKSRQDVLQRAVPGQGRIDAFAPQGVYLRQLYPGVERLDFRDAVVVAHWPTLIDRCASIDVLVASADDVGETSVEALHREAVTQFGSRLKWVVLTQGGGRVVAFDGEHGIEHEVTRVRQLDTTGAGDIFAAGLTEALAHGADMRSAIVHAAHWGATAVSMPGSAANPEQQQEYRSFAG